jgi:hypothetical protein
MEEQKPDPDRFLKEAKMFVVSSERGQRIPDIQSEELYIVWFSKTLQNWKALISTDKEAGLYWEVTFNGDKSEAYIDRYVKETNSVITVVRND